jgi:hypothetical protein
MSKLIITNNAMITLYVEENKPITPDFYNTLIINLQFHRLTCTCGRSGCLSIHGYYTRFLKSPDGKLPFRICRVICSCCHHTHALLPSALVPFSQISLSEQTEIISCHESGKGWNPLMNRNPSIDESNCRFITGNSVSCQNGFPFPMIRLWFSGASRSFPDSSCRFTAPQIFFLWTPHNLARHAPGFFLY